MDTMKSHFDVVLIYFILYIYCYYYFERKRVIVYVRYYWEISTMDDWNTVTDRRTFGRILERKRLKLSSSC